MNHYLIPLAITCIALSGCASPPVARESATFGVGAIGQMESALGDFRSSEAESYKARQASLTDQHRLAKKALASLANSSRMRESAGDYQSQAITQKLIGNAEAMGGDEAALISANKLDDATIAALATPLPSTRKATEAAQKSLAALGADLTAQAKYDNLKLFTSAIKTTVDSNKKKIEEAKNAAQAGTVSK